MTIIDLYEQLKNDLNYIPATIHSGKTWVLKRYVEDDEEEYSIYALDKKYQNEFNDNFEISEIDTIKTIFTFDFKNKFNGW